MTTTLLGMFRLSGDEDPLADIKALAAWVAKQPANDDIAFQEAMVRVLEAMGARQPRVTPNRILAVFELDRLSTPVQSRLLSQFLRPSLSDTVRQRLWDACDDLSRWFAYTYENLFGATQEFFLAQKAKALLPGVTARLFHYRGQQGRNALFRYERWMPAKWQGLHAVFQSVLVRGLAHAPFSLLPDGARGDRCSAEQEYLQTLLLQRINTGNLSAPQIDMAGLWLRGWAHTLALAPAPLEGPGFWLDFGLGDGLLTRKPHTARGTLLYLDVAPLHREIDNVIGELSVQSKRAGAPAIQAAAAERLALLQRLRQLWNPAARPIARRGERAPADRPVTVAVGLVDITVALQGTGNADGRARFRRLDPAAAGNGSRVRSVNADAQLIYTGGDRANSWHLHDTSESGCRLVSQSSAAAQQKLGSLLGIREEGDARWKIGIVRRLKNFSGGQTELGVGIVAQHALLIAPKPVTSRDTGYSVDGIDVSVEGFDALYLTPTPGESQPPQRSMIVPALDYAERRRYFLTVENAAYTIEFTRALERTKDWVWSAFDTVTHTR